MEQSEDGTETHTVRMSPRIPMSFKYNQEDSTIAENADPYEMPMSELYGNVSGTSEDNESHERRRLHVVISPDSMLTPSKEIRKQQIMEALPIVSAQITELMMAAKQDPQLAVVKMKLLNYFFDELGLDGNQIVPKEIQDQILTQGLMNTAMPAMGANGSMQPSVDAQMLANTPEGFDAQGNQLPPPIEAPEDQGAVGAAQPQNEFGRGIDSSLGQGNALQAVMNR